MSLKPSAWRVARRKRYKVSVDADKGRRRREDDMVEIRKKRKFRSLTQIIAGVMSEDRNLQLEATTSVRKLLSIERKPFINEVMQPGVVPRLVQFLSRDDFLELQFEAAWALANIASGTSEYTKVIIDSGAIPFFVRLLSSPGEEVREQAVRALGNVSSDTTKSRDLVLSCEAMMPLLAQFNEHSKLSMLRIATWALSNFCRGEPQPGIEQIKPALPVLQQLLHSTDENVLTDACWSLAYLSHGDNEKIQTFINAGVVPSLVQLLAHPSPSVLIPVLRAIGNIVAGDAMMIQEVIDAGIIKPLIHLVENGEFKIKKEALSAITNATSGGNSDQIKYLVNQGCIKTLYDLLACHHSIVVIVALEALKNILEVGKYEMNQGNTGGYNVYAQMIDDAGGLEKMAYLYRYNDPEICAMAVSILESHWPEENYFENDVAPENIQSSGVQFGNESGNAPTG